MKKEKASREKGSTDSSGGDDDDDGGDDDDGDEDAKRKILPNSQDKCAAVFDAASSQRNQSKNIIDTGFSTRLFFSF